MLKTKPIEKCTRLIVISGNKTDWDKLTKDRKISIILGKRKELLIINAINCQIIIAEIIDTMSHNRV